MGKTRIASRLEEAQNEKRLVRLERRFEKCRIRGYVLDIGPQFFLLALVNDEFWFDGFECFRIKDIVKCVDDPYKTFAEAVLRKRGQRRPKKPRVSVENVEKLLLSANRLFPLVTIHHEEIDPDVCHIGRVLSVNRGRVSLLEIDPGAIWDKTPTEYRLSEITRINFGGDYEDALHLVGGNPPVG